MLNDCKTRNDLQSRAGKPRFVDMEGAVKTNDAPHPGQAFTVQAENKLRAID